MASVTVKGCPRMTLRQHTNGSNTFYMSNMGCMKWSEEYISLRHERCNDIVFPPQVTLTSQIWDQLGPCH